MRRFAHFTFVVAVALLAIAAFRAYRVRAAAEEAARYSPEDVSPVWLPAGTAIDAVMWNGIAASARVGDPVQAFVPTQVRADGKLAILSGAQLRGELEQISKRGPKARVSVNFSVLIANGRSLSIQTRRVVKTIPIHSDIDTFSTAFGALLGASVGAAVGAASGDLRLIDRGVQEGAKNTISPDPAIHITVVLASGLEVLR